MLPSLTAGNGGGTHTQDLQADGCFVVNRCYKDPSMQTCRTGGSIHHCSLTIVVYNIHNIIVCEYYNMYTTYAPRGETGVFLSVDYNCES